MLYPVAVVTVVAAQMLGAYNQVMNQRDRGPAQAAAVPRAQLEMVYSTTAADGCRYTSVVRGTNPPRARGGDGAATYDPDLWVTSRLDCPDSVHTRPGLAVRGRGMTAEQIEQTIEHRAQLSRSTGQSVCWYRPDFEIGDAGLARFGGVAALCEPRSGDAARGGGPSGSGAQRP